MARCCSRTQAACLAARVAVASTATEGRTRPARGDELFYKNGRGEIVAVSLETHPTFSILGEDVLFSQRDALNFPVNFTVHRGDDVFVDGGSFTMVTRGGEEVTALIVADNFIEEIHQGAGS